MIVKKKLTWLRMLFFFRWSSLDDTWPRIAVITAMSVVVTWVEMQTKTTAYSLTPVPFSLIGLALSIFLGFRNNAAYDRYWEGRILWGGMVNIARSFTRQVTTLIVAPQQRDDAAAESPPWLNEFRRELVLRTIGYVHALRHHLRDSDPTAELEEYLPDGEHSALAGQKNVPLAVLQEQGQRLQQAWREGWLHDYHMGLMEESLTEITALQGGMERIKNTPIPFAYTVLIHRIVACYCFALPFGLVHTVGYLTPVVVMLISYAFMGLDVIGDEIEDPFSTAPHDLPLTAISRTIEVNLLQQIGETELPEIPVPQDDVLL
jgi:putative membrane protein